MKKIFLAIVLLATVWTTATAQSYRDEIKADPRKAASNYMAYPQPSGRLTPTPLGFTPYYISHYGRHGSRFLIDPQQYSRPLAILAHADSAGLLSPTGRQVLQSVRLMAEEASQRWGELTRLGAMQHRGIARRMISRFPEVFAGSAAVEARSTVVIRCILSMENELQELVSVNPKLKVDCDASEHDMYYMNCNDTAVERMRKAPEVRKVYDDWCSRHIDNRPLMHRLFSNSAFADTTSVCDRLADDLFSLATTTQNSAIADKVNLYGIFTTDELYHHWQQYNIGWYLTYGPSAVSDGLLPTSQINLVKDFVGKADSCLALSHPGATLRFGHDSDLLPLVCLLDIDGYGKQTACVDSLEDYGWINTRIFPMACNLQMVFYKPAEKTQPSADDIIVKILLNEEEATLPIQAAEGLSFDKSAKQTKNPYYRWSDVRKYMISKTLCR